MATVGVKGLTLADHTSVDVR